MYIQKCRELQITPDQRALPKQETEKPEAQTSLDGFVETTPNVKWSRQGLLEHILDFVVSDDQVSIVYDSLYPAVSQLFFSHSVSSRRHHFDDSCSINVQPRRSRIFPIEPSFGRRSSRSQKWPCSVLRRNLQYVSSFDHNPFCLTFFKNVPSRVSITFDAWTSKAYDPYLAITAHYIDAPSDQPLEWELKSKLLGFEELQGSHTGANVAVKIIEVLDQYDIRDKASFMFSSIRMPTHVYLYISLVG